jgi:formate-dependent nitrite reductase membrane component NrfD
LPRIPKLERLNSFVIICQLVALVGFILALAESKHPDKIYWMMDQGFKFIWWIGVVGLGLVLPLVFGFKKEERKLSISLLMSALVLLGGFFLRYVIVVAGQIII